MSLPIHRSVGSAREILGLDPLYVANKGKCIVIVKRKDSEKVLNVMKKNILGKNSKIIGEVYGETKGKVLLKTKIGGPRHLTILTGEQLPRICEMHGFDPLWNQHGTNVLLFYKCPLKITVN